MASSLTLTGQNDRRNGMMTRAAPTPFALLTLVAALGLATVSVGMAQDTNLPVIQGVEVDNRPLSWHPGKELSLGAFPRNIVFSIGPATNSSQKVMRLRTKLEGFDKEWQDGGGEMFVTMRFYNRSGDLVEAKAFEAHGENAGWNGKLESSTFTHRHETFSAPLDASRLWVILSSAGGPTTVGTYLVDNVIVSRLSAGNGPPEVLLRSPLPQELAKITSLNQAPENWERDGTRPSMAKIVEIGQNPKTKVLAVVDDDKALRDADGSCCD